MKVTWEPSKAAKGKAVKPAYVTPHIIDAAESESTILKLDAQCKARSGIWQLGYLDLRAECAEFYLLEAAHMQEPENVGVYLLRGKKAAYLAEMFSRYTDMVIGGELRHAMRFTPKDRIGEIPPAIRSALTKADMIVSKREDAWQGWWKVKQRYGVKALEWAETTFNLGGHGGYGGFAWGTIVGVLKDYERKELGGQADDVVFVNLCWNLQHNGGIYFNKLWPWHLGELKRELTAAHEGRYQDLLAMLAAVSPDSEVLRAVKKVLKGVADDGEHVQ